MFISFEGIDGSGKTHQIKILQQWLQGRAEIVTTREPGGTKGAELLRDIIVNGPTDRWSAETEILLFSAARRDHVERVIAPALKQGAVVLCDRYVDSTRVYQGVTRGDLRQKVDEIHKSAINLEADLTLIFDLSPSIAASRLSKRNDSERRFEDFGNAFQEKLRNGFLKLAEEFPKRCFIINADDCPENISARVRKIILDNLANRS